MQKLALRVSLCVVAILICGVFVSTPLKSAARSLSKSEVLALVAGQSLPENIVADLAARGLDFTPDENYKSQLKIAGADSRVLAALDAAKTSSGTQSASPENVKLLQNLSVAGQKISAGRPSDAMNDVNAALATGSGHSAVGFVMGMILIQEGRYVEAGQIYSEIQRDEPNFPELHTRLSFTYHSTGDEQNALREAKAAIAENPNNAPAHLNAGLALSNMGNIDAAKLELQESIRSKPDYQLAYIALANILETLKDYDGAIAQYKRAVTLNPNDVNAHYNLGIAYQDRGDYVSSIREYREAKRLDPSRRDVRQNLGHTLIDLDPAAAVVEFRELAAIAPEWPLCHQCLAKALRQAGRLDEAEAEYRTAQKLDPASPDPHFGLGVLFEMRKQYDKALSEYTAAQQINDDDDATHISIGRILMMKKDYLDATTEFQRAKELDPTNCIAVNSLGEAYEASGKRDAATREFREGLSTCPKVIAIRLNLAAALEKRGDWVAALDNYHQAALDEPPPKLNFAQINYQPQMKYQDAQKRFAQHLADLRSGGKSSEADKLEASMKTKTDSAGLDEKYHDTVQACMKAMGEQRFNEAETLARQALEIAEKIQPTDGRLPEAVGTLGTVYGRRLEFTKAEELFKRQLALSEKLYGPQNPLILTPVQNLAMLTAQEKNFPESEKYFARALEINEKSYGLESSAYAQTLLGLGQLYTLEQNYAKSEATILRVLHTYENTYENNSIEMTIPLTGLCYVYDQWGKPDKSAPCHARIVAVVEKQFGSSSPYLVPELSAEAKALRQLGRNDEAAKLEQRTQALQSAQVSPN